MNNKRNQENSLPRMLWYWSQTTEMMEWQWNPKMLNSIVGGSFLLPISIVLEPHTHINIIQPQFFPEGLSHTQRKLTSFPFAGKTLCLTHGPSHLIAEQTSGGYHSSVIALFYRVYRYTLRILLNTGTHIPKTSETYMPSLATVSFSLLCAVYTKCQNQNPSPSPLEPCLQNKPTLEKRSKPLIFFGFLS